MQQIISGSAEREILPVVILPTREMGTDKGVIRAFAQGVESMGFWSTLTYDHLIGTARPTGNNHYTNHDSFHEPLILFSFLAGVTQKIQFMTGVLVLPLRNTIVVAKQVSELANLSEGRLHLGIGVGPSREEFKILGREFNKRGERLERQVQLLRDLWRKETVTYTDADNNTEAFGISPRPNYEIPIWMGGWSDVVLERTARLADGWMPMGHPEDIEPRIERFRELLMINGKDPGTFPILGAFGRQYSLDGSEKRSLGSFDDLEEFEQRYFKLKALGVSHIAFGTMRAGFKGIDEHLRHLEKCKSQFDKLQENTHVVG